LEKALRGFMNEEERKNLWRSDAQSSQQLNTLEKTYSNAKRALLGSRLLVELLKAWTESQSLWKAVCLFFLTHLAMNSLL
jgi:hypothetical protein